MKHPRLTAIFAAVSAASLLMASSLSFAGHRVENYKGEANFKAEVPPPCPPIMLLKDGFYIGAGVGYDSGRVHQRSDTSLTDITGPIFTQTTSFNHSATGWMGGLFAGYGKYFDWFYLGLEINGNWSASDSTFSYQNILGVDVNTKVRTRGSYGIALLPGLKINDSTLFYVRLGYLRTNFKGTGDFTLVDPTDATVDTFSVSSNRWVNGFNYGVGLESYVVEDVSLRGEFTHTTYNSRSATATFVDPLSGDTITSSTKFEPSNNEFMLSLIYHFCL